MKAARNNAVTASYLFLRRGSEILLARRCNTHYQDGNYQVPAGHVDAGELPTEALIREAKEEIGIDIKRSDIRFVHASFRPKHDHTGDRVDYFFEVTTWSGEIINAEPQKCDDLKWCELDTLPENMSPHIRIAIEAYTKGQYYSELSLEFLKSTNMYEITE